MLLQSHLKEISHALDSMVSQDTLLGSLINFLW